MDFSELSDVEMLIALKLSDGLSHSEIAACVDISTSAVKERIRSIVRKVGTNNKITLAVAVLKARIGTK